MFWDVDSYFLTTRLRPPTHFTQTIKQAPINNGLCLLPTWAPAKAFSYGTALAFLMTKIRFNVCSLPSNKWTDDYGRSVTKQSWFSLNYATFVGKEEMFLCPLWTLSTGLTIKLKWDRLTRENDKLNYICTHGNSTYMRESEAPHTWEGQRQEGERSSIQHSQLRRRQGALGFQTVRKSFTGWEEE